MSEYYEFIQEIKGVKGAVIGSFLLFFLSVKNGRSEKAKLPFAVASFWKWFKAHRTDCGTVMLANEHLWQ